MNKRTDLLNQAIAEHEQEHDASAPAPVVPAARRFHQNRLAGLEETSKMLKKPILRLKPSECTIWPGNARDYEALNESRLKSLIDSILSTGANQVPATVRRRNDPEKPYEVIVGTRRHWSVAWLNANLHPEVDFVAYVEDLEDAAAFKLADLENREREDISDLERGANYKWACETYYGGVQSRMAEHLNISNANLSRFIALSNLPAAIIAAFASPADLQVDYGAKLTPLLRDPQVRARLEAAASEISMAQSLRQAEGQDPIRGSEVMAQLIAKSIEKRGRPARPEILADGAPIGKIITDSKSKGLTLNILPNGQSVDDILESLRPIIEAAKFNGGKRARNVA